MLRFFLGDASWVGREQSGEEWGSVEAGWLEAPCTNIAGARLMGHLLDDKECGSAGAQQKEPMGPGVHGKGSFTGAAKYL